MHRASLNHTYRLVWSDVENAFVAVAENVKGRGKKSRSGQTLSALSLVAASAILAGASGTLLAQALPAGGTVVAGSASISTSGSTMTVTQTTAKMSADWQSFNIGQGNTVNFVQPSNTSVAMNRVLGADVSVIQGALNANGQVFLINPNGVLFTPTAQVNVGGIVASTLNMRTADFMAGSYKFEGSSSNAIINQGNITAANGGTIALIAAKITNTGTLTANQGNVLLGAGSKVTLDLGGPVKLQVEQGAIDARIENGGAIKADGGLVYLTAKAAGDLASSVINHTGLIEAHSLAANEKGEIYLMGDAITLASGSKMDASGATGGGTVLVGGDWQGSGSMHQATTVTMAAGANIDASATVQGDGGKVVLWSKVDSPDSVTQVDGSILASGAPGGNGGQVETSGHSLGVTGSVNAGPMGQWLLDPIDLTITSSGSTSVSSSGGTLSPGTNNATVLNTSINTALNNGNNVTIQTSGGTGGSGNITVAAAITKSSGASATLTLKADANIYVAANIASTSGKLKVVLNADASGGGSGSVGIFKDISITTLGGDVIIGGGLTPLTGYAVGNNNTTTYSVSSGPVDNRRGVTVTGTIDAGGGNVTINGKGNSAGARGVSIGGMIKTSGSGTISISGIGTNTSDGVALGDGTHYDVASNTNVTETLNGSIVAASGTVTINGTQSSANKAFNISTAGSGITSSGDVGLTAVNGSINLLGSTAAQTLTLTGASGATVSGSGNITATNLLLNGIGATYTLNTASENSVGTLAATGVAGLNFLNNVALTIGTVGSVNGISATGLVDVGTNAGNLTVAQNVATTNITATAVLLNAGKTTAAGTATGGNIIISGTPTIRTGAGGRATLMTGSVADSTGVTALVGSGSGRFRYKSDEAATNYSAALGTGTYAIYREQPTITVTPGTATSTYGNATSVAGVAGTVTGYVNGDATSTTTGTASFTTTATNSSHVGAYNIAYASGLSNGLGYGYADATGSTGEYSITARPLTATITNSAITKVYDGTTSAPAGFTPSYSFTGLVNGATAAALTNSGAAYDSAHVASATMVTVSGLAISGITGGTGLASDYVLTGTTSKSVTARITPATLTPSISNTGATKVYDGTTSAPAGFTPTYTFAGLLAGDTAATLTNTGAAYDNAHVASASKVTVSGLAISGITGTALASDYGLNATSQFVTASITPATLTVTANADAKLVTQTDAVGFNGVSYTGLVGGETSAVLGGTLAIARSNSGTEGAATYTGVLLPSGYTSSDYTFNYVHGNYTIVPAAQLLVKVANTSTTYGMAPTYSITSAQYLNGTSVITALTQSSASGNTSTWSDGAGGSATFTLAPSVASNSSSGNTLVGNYAIIGGTPSIVGSNFNELNFIGNLAVVQKPLTANASNISKVYDGSTAMNNVTIGLTGLLTNDVVTVSGAGAFASKNVGSNLSFNLNNLALSGADQGNYYLSGGTSFTGSNGTITPASISAVTGITAANKTYDGTTGATLNTDSATFTGMVGGDVLNVASASAVFADKNAGTAKTVNISAITLGGTDVANYTLSSSTASTLADIDQAALTLSTGNVSKTYDGNLTAAGTAVVTSGTVFSGDTLSGGTFAFTDKNVGSGNKTVTSTGVAVGDGTNNGNYNVSYANNTTSTIDKANATVTANSGTGTYSGLAQSVSGFTATGLVNGELATVLTNVSASGSGTNAGTYTSTATGTDSNYNLTLNTGTLTIDQRPITLTADAKTKVYGNSDPTLTYVAETASGDRGLVSGETLGGSLSRASGETAGDYAIAQGTVNETTNPNYAINFVGSNLSIAAVRPGPTPTQPQQAAVSVSQAIAANAIGDSGSTPASAAGLFAPNALPPALVGGSANISQSGGLTFVDVPAVSGSQGGDAAGNANNTGTDRGRDASGFMRVFVVNGGIHLPAQARDLAEESAFR